MSCLIKTLYYYDETSPSGIRWNVDRFSGRGRVIAYRNDVAGTLACDEKYYNAYVDRKLMRVAKIIMLLHDIEVPEGYIVDHFDGNTKNNKFSNLRVISQLKNCRNRRKQYNNTSGTVGVTRKTDKSGHSYWVARWQVEVGKRGTKTFSIFLHGEDGAYNLAVDYRLNKIIELTKLGHGYTDRHGK